jgi:hypothetical protein
VSSLFIACKDDKDNEEEGNAHVQMMLTDAAGPYQKVLIDIQEVNVNVEGKGWVNLSLFRTGIYNLLDFRNGIDTMIASHQIPAGNLQEIRLVLGSQNHVVIDGIQHELETPSAQQSGLKIKIKEPIRPGGKYVIWIDFDANKSIVNTGSGKYILKPVIRAFLKYNTGSISGDINPDAAADVVHVINPISNDTFTTIPFDDGRFSIIGLPANTYNIHMYKGATQVKAINAVVIFANANNNLGSIDIP